MRNIVAIVLLACVSFAYAEESRFFQADTEHYRVYAEESQAQADDVGKMMEGALLLYVDLFHFDPSTLPAKLRIKVFRDIDGFNSYLNSLLSQTRKDFVFVAYSDPEKSELLCFPKDEAAFVASLVHQGCIQFLKSFVVNPPVWLREGVATYLEAASYDAENAAFSMQKSLTWVDSLKTIVKGESAQGLVPISDFLLYTREMAQSQLDLFYPQAWGLVSFLLNSSNKTYNRVFWDSISALDSKATLADNSQRVRLRAFSWVSEQTIAKDFQDYVLSLKTVPDLLRDGIDLYAKGDLDKAAESFQAAQDLEPESAVAAYYLGLIAYARREYDAAGEYYAKSRDYGLAAGLVNYALGVNAFAGGKYEDASIYLAFSKEADPAAYGEKVDSLQKRIDLLK